MRDIDTLRENLFDILERLKSGAIDIERAKVMNEVSQTIINSAKAEVDFVKVTGATQSQFFETQKTITKLPGATVTKHKLIG